MDVKTAAQKLEISQSLLYRLIAEKRIDHYRIGGRHRRGKIVVDDEAIRAFREECRAELADD